MPQVTLAGTESFSGVVNIFVNESHMIRFGFCDSQAEVTQSDMHMVETIDVNVLMFDFAIHNP